MQLCHQPSRQTPRSGSTLLLALMVMMVVAAMTLAFLQIGIRFSAEQSNRIDDERALMLAEVGLAESVTAMRLGLSGNVGSAAAPARQGDGVLWATVTPVGQALDLVQSSAMCGAGRVSLEQLVFHYPPNDLDSFAIFANNDLTINSNVLIDSFDIAGGPYATQLAATGTGYVSDKAVSGSNGDIEVEPSVQVWGDMHPGLNKSVSVAGSSFVSGSLQPLPEIVSLPPVVTPALPAAGNLTVAALGVVVPSGDYQFGVLATLPNTSATISGPARIVTTSLNLGSNSSVHLDSTGGPIEIYVRGASNLASNAQLITNKQSAKDCSLFLVGGPGQDITLNSNSEFYGRIYSPEGRIVVGANFEVFGSVVADRLVLNANSRVHYDEGLKGAIGPGDERFVAYGWSKSAFPDPNLLTDRRDPFALLGVVPASLSSPAAAHVP